VDAGDASANTAQRAASAEGSRANVVTGGIGEHLLANQQGNQADEQQRAEIVTGLRDLLLVVLVRQVVIELTERAGREGPPPAAASDRLHRLDVNAQREDQRRP